MTEKNEYVYPLYVPFDYLKPEYKRLNLSTKYILGRILGLSKRCANKQIKISNSLLKHEMGFDAKVIRRAFNQLENLKLIKIDWSLGSRRIINILFEPNDLRVLNKNIETIGQTPTVDEKIVQESVGNTPSVNNAPMGQTPTESETNTHTAVGDTPIHKYEYKVEEIDIYRKRIYKKILNDLSEGSIAKIFMRDPENEQELESYKPFYFDPKEDVDEHGECPYTYDSLDSDGYNLSQWMATNITYLGELCLIGKYGDDCFSIYAESLLKRWNPKKASLGKFLKIAVPNDFKGFKTRAVDYVQQYLDREIVVPTMKKFIKQRNSPSKVLDALAYDYLQYFSAVQHDMDFGRYIYRLMYQTVKEDCEDVYTPFDPNRDFPSEEDLKFDWGKQWFDAWSSDPATLTGEAQETALRIIPFHKGLYGKEVMFDAFFD